MKCKTGQPCCVQLAYCLFFCLFRHHCRCYSGCSFFAHYRLIELVGDRAVGVQAAALLIKSVCNFVSKHVLCVLCNWSLKMEPALLMTQRRVVCFMQTTMKLLKNQSLLEVLLSTATSLTTKLTANMTPHHKGLRVSSAATAAADADITNGYKLRFGNKINAYR